MRVQGRSRVEPAPKRVRGGGELQVEHALVLRGVGVALLYHVIAPGEIAVELAARARCARDHQPAVPLVRKPQEKSRLAGRVRRDARVELQAGHRFGDRGALAWVGRDSGTD